VSSRRHLAVFWVAFGLAACHRSPARDNETQAVSPARIPTPDPKSASLDSIKQFLLTAAATDFRNHRPPDPARFRDVRLGHLTSPSGERQYRLCGQLLPAHGGDEAEWTPFATIQTSYYEQWIGGQATRFCQGPTVEWDEVGDLSSALQNRLDSLR